MKKSGLFLALVLTAAMLLGGCSKQNTSSVVPANAQPESQAASQAVLSSEQESVQEAQSSQPASSQADSFPDNGTVSQNGPVLNITTDNEDFNKLFKNNPIDKKYISESADAVSSADMVKLSDKYAGIWQKEVTYAYGELTKYMKLDSSSTKPAELKAEQEKWESGKTAALKKIADDAQAEGGSMAQVDASSKVMDFYRSRAAQIYRELYEYNKNFAYNYPSK